MTPEQLAALFAELAAHEQANQKTLEKYKTNKTTEIDIALSAIDALEAELKGETNGSFLRLNVIVN